MAWFAAVAEASRLRAECARLTEALATEKRFTERIAAEARELHETVADRERAARDWRELSIQRALENRLLTQLLEDRNGDRAEAEGLRQRLIVLERANATAVTSNEWAVGHINLLTHERNAILSAHGGAVSLPNAEFQYRPPSEDDPPPPGPIAAAPSIAGRPIPEGKTAGDVIAALRARRDREREQVPADPADLLKQAGDLFEEAGVPGASEPPTTDPFADIP